MVSIVGCAGAIVLDGERRLLLIQRGKAPDAGRWSLPGGRVEPGETSVAAVVREVWEETGLQVRAQHLVGHVERDGPGEVVYAIDDWSCTVVDGTLRAGDDAWDARFVDTQELGTLELSPGLIDALTGWGVLPL